MPRLKKKTVKRGKSGPKKLYFGKEAHEAIVEYQSTECRRERHKIYEAKIRQSFNKLVENLIFIHGFARDPLTFQTLKIDCVTFLYETLEKFDPERGSKAFSYFNVCAKNFLIIQTNKSNKKNRRSVSFDDYSNLSAADRRSIDVYSYVPSPESTMIQREDRDRMFEVLGIIESKIKNENEKLCVQAVGKLFKDIDSLEFLNKRAIFVYLREISGLNPKQLSVAMSSVRKHFREIVKNNDEYQSMKSEIARIGANTEWNGKKIFDGIGFPGETKFQVGADAGQTIGVAIVKLENSELGKTTTTNVVDVAHDDSPPAVSLTANIFSLHPNQVILQMHLLKLLLTLIDIFDHLPKLKMVF